MELTRIFKQDNTRWMELQEQEEAFLCKIDGDEQHKLFVKKTGDRVFNLTTNHRKIDEFFNRLKENERQLELKMMFKGQTEEVRFDYEVRVSQMEILAEVANRLADAFRGIGETIEESITTKKPTWNPPVNMAPHPNYCNKSNQIKRKGGRR